MNKSGGIGALVLAFICTCNSPALAHFTKLDNFQRKPSSDMDPTRWQENQLDFSIVKVGNKGVAQARDNAVMTYVGNLHGLSTTTDWFGATAIHNSQPTDEYAGLVLRYANLSNFVLVAMTVIDHDPNGLFDHIQISRGASPPYSWYSITEIKPTADVALRARIANDFSHPGMLQVVVQIDGNHNGIWGEPEDDTLVRGNLNPAGLGTGVGLAGTGGAELDDFGGYKLIPEPATLAMLICGGLAFRRRLHCLSR